MSGSILADARRAAGLSQQELAHVAGTSRPTVSAYEHGRKSPSLATVQRLLAACGFELHAQPIIRFVTRHNRHGRPFAVPDRLPRLDAYRALATIQVPLRLNWSEQDRVYRLADRADRARVYEIVLREGQPGDILDYIDGALLVDLWSELVLPAPIRDAWAPLIKDATSSTTAAWAS